MKTLQRSKGAVLLARTGKTEPELAEQLGVSRQLVGFWKSGRRVPSKVEHRASMRAAFGIPLEAWDEAAELDPKPRRSRTPSIPPAYVWGTDAVRARVAQLDGVYQKLIADAEGAALSGERARAAQSAAVILEKMGRITGELLDMPDERAVRLPAVRRVLEAIVAASSAWPEAQKAISERLQEFDRTG